MVHIQLQKYTRARPADFNAKLREVGVDKKVTVQKICRACKDEKDVRSVLDEIWEEPLGAPKALAQTLTKNQSVFEFENILLNRSFSLHKS